MSRKKARIKALEAIVLTAMRFRPLATDPLQVKIKELCPDLFEKFHDRDRNV